MNIQQLEYTIALAKNRSFSKAAEACFVTQPALTIQIKRLEEELGAKIFDRDSKPIEPTEVGKKIIAQAKIILNQTGRLKDISSEFFNELSGSLKIGVIPTVSPYLIPLFISQFTEKYPEIKLNISEEITENILQLIKEGELDAGIIVTPVSESQLHYESLFYEKFYVYVSTEHDFYKQKNIKSKDLNLSDMWLLKEGNCFRNQIINICSYGESNINFNYESVSIDSLIRIVDKKKGITLLPELAALEIVNNNSKQIKAFKDLSPIREVSLVSNKKYRKRKMLEMLQNEIIKNLPQTIISNKKKNIISTNL